MRWQWIPGPARRSSAGSERGFTLLEVMIALVVLGGAIAASSQAVALGLRAQGSVRSQLEAVALAESRMQALALLPLDSLPSYAAPREGAFDPPFRKYRWQAVLRPDAVTPRLVQAAVRVEWPTGDYSLETTFYRADRVSPVTGGAR